jgi:nitroreductase
MNIIDALEWRYASKKFDKNRKLSEEQIDVLKKAFNLSATSYGLQPLKMLIVKSDEIKEKIFPLAYFQQQVTTCSHILIICIDSAFGEKEVDDYFDLEKDVRGVSEEVVGKFRHQLKLIYRKKDRKEIDISAVYQAYIALGTLMTVCADQQIDSCPMEGFNPKKVDEVLGLDAKNLKSVLMLPVGYRAEDDIMRNMKKVRKPLEEVIIELD